MSPIEYDFIVFDAGFLINSLTPIATKGETFSKYFEKSVFFFKNSSRIWFRKKIRYRLGPLQFYVHKESTTDKRGHSCGQRVKGSAKVPMDWQTFLKNADKKKIVLHICPVCYGQDNCQIEKSCTSHKMIVWSIWVKDLQWDNATMERQIPAH